MRTRMMTWQEMTRRWWRQRLVPLVGLALLSGCAVAPGPADEAKPQVAGDSCVGERKLHQADFTAASADPASLAGAAGSCGSCQQVEAVGRDSCFSLRPGKSIPCTKTVKLKNGRKKTVRTTRTSRCQPQSLIYARCRSGIDNCRLGDTSPVQWFSCARKQGVTSPQPKAGSVIVLGANRQRGMPTGHPAFVEEACPNGDGTWTLRLSHTNFDRRCNLDQDARVVYCPKTMRARFLTGPWSAWAKNLEVLGFIVR